MHNVMHKNIRGGNGYLSNICQVVRNRAGGTGLADQAFAGPVFAFVKIIHNSDVVILMQYTVHTHYNHDYFSHIAG